MKKCFTTANKEIIDWFTKDRFEQYGAFAWKFSVIVGSIVATVAGMSFITMWFLDLFHFNKTEYMVALMAVMLFYFIIAMYAIKVHTVCKRIRIEAELLKLYEGYTIKWVSTMNYCTTVTLHNYGYLDVFVRAYEENKVVTVYDGDL